VFDFLIGARQHAPIAAEKLRLKQRLEEAHYSGLVLAVSQQILLWPIRTVRVYAGRRARCMKLKTRLLLATALTALVILGAAEWLNYVSMAGFLNSHKADMELVRDHTSWVTDLERSKHDLFKSLVLLHVAHACLTVLGLICVLHILWWRLFLRPLEQILRHIHVMGLGTWTDPIRLERHDEIGDLIKAFNALGDQIAASVQQVSATSKLSAMALLGSRIVRKTVVVRDHVRAIQIMLEAARQEGGVIPEPAVANLTTIARDLDEIANQFEAEFAHEFESHSVGFGAALGGDPANSAGKARMSPQMIRSRRAGPIGG
jgi:methyl-accepting chemotaxis protein